ncbi:GNAT family N-acetyltransferase [Streptomyces sp. NPDC005955]|uniref:GNAT family N-acetyltransferase n=1 Tax=Streptomyces sp. NPDC005955 TaxID=3364738 RepID=UPI0036804E18
MPEIELLRADHASALCAFERDNRAYFAASVPDRGDGYFAEFEGRHRALLAEQAAGHHYFHLVVGEDGEVLGRVNLVDVAGGAAELGFRIARKAAGRGLATEAVRRICVTARDYGLRSLRARAAVANGGSRAVLVRTGFVQVGGVDLDGAEGHLFRRSLGEPTA